MVKYTKREKKIVDGLNALVKAAYGASVKAGWYHNLRTGRPKRRNLGEMLMLMVTEIAEATEGERKGLMDDKLKHRQMAEVELGDAIIRMGDYSGHRKFKLGEAIVEKMRYNRKRADHKASNRRRAGGKKF